MNQFEKDVITRYREKMASIVKQAEGMSLEDLKGLTRTIGEAMVPQSIKDLGSILSQSGYDPVTTHTNTLTRAIFNDENGRPISSALYDDEHDPVDFTGDPDAYINSKYY